MFNKKVQETSLTLTLSREERELSGIDQNTLAHWERAGVRVSIL